ncbi:hypothetical protein B7P43_G16231 [Cryptotermes secundus]|uniref:Arrestin C-terminal-like domain-containing protein n=1 Tax=Cryptotermes secundus TaxID=105785 RepID=A0A2J7RTD5_9NEOP|nr:hypothetical protein B7P43_G16231 [Cryptotermes secundus]PNF44089.1 hypothetical protein B7P43_G16231 [Cryptotermes secundus]
MVLKDLKLIFDNSHCTFFSGQTVSGRLVVELDAPEYLSSILVKFRGEANCSWSETNTIRRNGNDETQTTTYTDNDLYFEKHMTLFGGSGSTEMLPAGSHFFQFCMVVPNHLPSSFEGKYGHIRYTVKGILDRPWTFSHEVMASFIVMSTLDLNLDPVNKTVSYYCASPRGSKEESMVVAELALDGPVAENECKTWTVNMRIPPAPPSMLNSCSIIDLTYRLMVKAVPKGLHRELIHCTSIIIGTVPLRQSSCPQQALPTPTAPASEPVAAHMPLPTYEECMHSAASAGSSDNSKHMPGTMGYNPRYPYYPLQGTEPDNPATACSSFK